MYICLWIYCDIMEKLRKVKDYVKDHRAELVVFGIMAGIMTAIGLAAGLHPLDAVARNGRR
jgi:hypothetical protein